MPKSAYDVIILGAGAAGLAAAGVLEERGLKIMLLEARDRVGGRIFTKRERGLAHPLELGAEFIHGEPEETLSIVRAAGLTIYDCLDLHHFNARKPGGRNPGLKEKKNYFDQIGKIMAALDKNRRFDRSFEDFAKAHGYSGEKRDLAIAFAEGFNGGPKELMSEMGLARANEDEDDGGQTKMCRFANGYDQIVEHLVSRIKDPDASIRLGRIASKIEWRPGAGATVHSTVMGCDKEESFRARKVLVTLPIGVLQSAPGELGHLAFEPVPNGYEAALDGARMGHAVRLLLRFRKPVWLNDKRKKVGFLHGSHTSALQTWWTMMPVHGSVITAWAGGPAAERLTGKTSGELAKIALENLAGLLGKSATELGSELQSVQHHDWTSDPFSRGAYSYIRVGGAKNIDRLKKGFGATIFFAGEGTNPGGARGTVDGAIATGISAAKAIARTGFKKS